MRPLNEAGPAPAPAIALETDAVRVSYLPGSTGVAVVAFTGIGHAMGAIQTEEFRRALGSDRGQARHAAIFVIDRERRWYNDGIASPIAECVNGLMRRLGVRRCVTLGNSMGGFGAIVFARRLADCSGAIAFCPQSSVDPAIVPFETRWTEWRASIRRWEIRDAVTEIAPGIAYDLFFGADDQTDALHEARFSAAGCERLRIHRVANCGHDVSLHLKAQGRLRETIEPLIGAVEALVPS